MMETKRIKLVDVNPYLMCTLCSGYIIDAMTIIECLHSFCKTCIYQYLESNKFCPVCDVQVHKTKPLLNVRSDKTFQALIYKIVPGLYKDEMERRRLFYAQNAERGINPASLNLFDQLTPEYPTSNVLSPSETLPEWISLCLELSDRLPPFAKIVAHGQKYIQTKGNPVKDQRHLFCPAGLTVGHLKKFLRGKFDLYPDLHIDVYHSDEILKDVYSLCDIASIYTWRRTEPMKLYYVVYKMVESASISFDVDVKTNYERVVYDVDIQPTLIAKRNPKSTVSTKSCSAVSKSADDVLSMLQKSADAIYNRVSESAAGAAPDLCAESKAPSLQKSDVLKSSDALTKNVETDDNESKNVNILVPAFLLIKPDFPACTSETPSSNTIVGERRTNSPSCLNNACLPDQSSIVSSFISDKTLDSVRNSENGITSNDDICSGDMTNKSVTVAKTPSKTMTNSDKLLSSCVGDVDPCVSAGDKCGFEAQPPSSDVESHDQAKKENRPTRKRSSEIEQLFLDRNTTREVRNLYRELAMSSDKNGRSALLRLRLRTGSTVRRRSVGLNSSRGGKARAPVSTGRSKPYSVRQKLSESNKRK